MFFKETEENVLHCIFFIVFSSIGDKKTGREFLMKRAKEETVIIEITFIFNNLKCVRMRPIFQSSSKLKFMKFCYQRKKLIRTIVRV